MKREGLMCIMHYGDNNYLVLKFCSNILLALSDNAFTHL